MSVYEGDLDAPLDVARGDDEDRTNLIINYLPQSMTDNELFSMFVTCGPLVQARIIRDRKSGYSFGYGFVHYENPKDAKRAIETLSGLAIQNKTIKVSYARPNTELIKDSNLYIANLGCSVTEEAIHSMFSTYGKIVTLNLLKDPITGKPKGVAFVRYSKQSEAKDAITALNGTMMTGNDKPMLVKVAEEHGKQNVRYFMPNWAGEQHGGRGANNSRGNRGNFPRGRHVGNRFNPMTSGAGRGNTNYIY
ncbi:ELAV-like protein 1-B,ELAV-like protein 2,ELAV-like protein 1,ELAV-like protein 1-A,Sex-lethal homolog,Protein sex-lethal,ELAV-like protein 3,ELAV-like protein 4 [Lepeophtheirus salmonis]|nr:sex-lethal homolog isoform X2 [Lepeophtheirus salmonis]CAB4056377.1 ELAV-like protein 1-B,ELAV-like protein 2,ELAV-like protein 1,ELAV-like protein 1-A,Sex-lethal homolog,Protein sex-lethal,ELAV-like protein 3,ELAV-like protein 4 [Lepeophtheirus salmonis]CAF2797122.1 ELAV-like protein 1-B,ELAV-like protein 2,ELAV-like protein 1,ELAV-like protein 1-A,Sex-lethal homolog,Protein sex-lethal,ELAV-like protein 3,ELAV-like protein 4 [Lepeophtheirus salmonis]